MIPVREHFRNAPALKAPAKPDMEKRELVLTCNNK